MRVVTATETRLSPVFRPRPYHPVAFEPAWRSETVAALARQMYDSDDFSALPILADALQDAGCDRAEILNHCAEPCRHVRGCWVVDLVLGGNSPGAT